MAITSGFFNSVSGDRLYNADQIGDMFKGLISDGVYESVGNAFQLTAAGGLNISVGSGRAFVGDKWCDNDGPVTITVNSASATLNRYTAIVLRRDISERTVTIAQIDGTAASSPSKPLPVRNATQYDILLGYVYVKAGATAVTQNNIIDMRGSVWCHWVTGLINQVDTSTLFAQYQAAYEAMIEQMQEWQTTQQAAFNSWYSALTSQLTVNTYLQSFKKIASLASTSSRTISLDMTDYTYEQSDIVLVFINGLLAVENTDYTMDTTASTPTVTVSITPRSGVTNVVEIRVLKSKIGDPSGGGGSDIRQININEQFSSSSTESASGEVD